MLMVNCTQTLSFATCVYDMYCQVARKCEYRLPIANVLLHPHSVSCGVDAYRQPALLQKDWGSSPRTGQSPAQLVRCAFIIPACHGFGGAACSTSQFKSLLLSLSIKSEASCIKGHHTAKISTGCLGWVHAPMYQTPVAGMLKSVVCIFSAMTWSQVTVLSLP